MVDRVEDEAVGSGLGTVLHREGQLGGSQWLLDAIHVHTEDVGVWGEERRRRDVTRRLMITFGYRLFSFRRTELYLGS